MIDKFGRPSWDDWNMAIATMCCIRSIDPRTKHGAYIVDSCNRPLSLGYNGPLRGADDNDVSLDPEDKLLELEHAERNAIFNTFNRFDGGTAYVTGHPCVQCFRALAQCGVVRIVYGPIKSVSLTDKEVRVINKMKKYRKIVIEEYKGDFYEILITLLKYLKTKDVYPKNHKILMETIRGLIKK